MRLHPVADRDDDIQVEKLDVTGDLAATFGLNCCKSCNSCLRRQFTRCEDMVDMLGNGGLIALEQLCHLSGGKPDRLVDKPDFDLGLSILRLVENEAGLGLFAHGWRQAVANSTP